MLVTFPIIICILSLFFHPSAQAQHEYDVIIMGAGAAGISAAKTLYEANITNILIIEANWYVGGRTVVHHFGSGYMLNIGASWISGACINNSSDCSHYTEINPLLTAADKYNISYVISQYDDGITLDFGGNEHNITDSNNKYEKFSQASDCAYNINNGDHMSFFAALNQCGWKEPLSSIEKTTQWVNFDFEAQHAKWSSAREDFVWGTYNTYGPDNLFIIDRRGMQGIIKSLANEFLDIANISNDDKIILNSPITTIEYNENGVTVTANNSQYSAKYGCITFSLGVLQSDIVDFFPKLPQWKLDSLLAFDFIDYTIILVEWPYNFWNSTIVNISEFIILNDDRFGFFTWIYNLDHPNLYSGSLIWRFDITLDLATMVQHQSINDTIKQIIDLKLSHYFDNIPQPTDVFVAPWNKNKYVQGSYSNWPPGFTSIQKQAMSWPVLQRLFFAGEAFTDSGHGRYVHSALISGNNTANQILACMGLGLDSVDCPSKYPPSTRHDCKEELSVLIKDLLWLWIVLGLIFGIILGYFFAKYCSKNSKNEKGANYSSVDNMDVPMVAQQNTNRL